MATDRCPPDPGFLGKFVPLRRRVIPPPGPSCFRSPITRFCSLALGRSKPSGDQAVSSWARNEGIGSFHRHAISVEQQTVSSSSIVRTRKPFPDTLPQLQKRTRSSSPTQRIPGIHTPDVPRIALAPPPLPKSQPQSQFITLPPDS